jgi:hypothetical protein
MACVGVNGAGPLVENRANLSPEAFAPLAAALAVQPTIKHALDWLLGHTPPVAPHDAVTQDEFSSDVLVSYPGGLVLSYDTT